MNTVTEPQYDTGYAPRRGRVQPPVAPASAATAARGTTHGQAAMPQAWGTAPRRATGATVDFSQTPPGHAVVKLRRAELANLTAQLAIMLKSGVDIASALQSVARQSNRPAQRDLLNTIYTDVLGGNSFSTALQPYAAVFGPSYVATVAAGEASGQMAAVLAQLAELMRAEVRLRNSIRTLLAYPLLLIAVAGFVLAALTLGVLPRFAEIFAQFDTPLPAMTRMLLAVSAEIRHHIWLWIPLGLATVGGGIVLLRSETGQRWWHHFTLRAVVIRTVTRDLLTSRLCRLLALMINSGVPLLDSLRIVRTSIRNHLYAELLDRLIDNVVNGRGLGNDLGECSFFPPSAAEMLTTAERTANMGEVTKILGEHFQEEGERRLRDIVAILEPIITVGMGILVAVVVLAVMLPVFDMASFARG